jgi:hypothetical protein
MSLVWKTRLTIAAKHAVNSILVNASLMLMISDTFNYRTWTGLVHIGEAVLATVLARELAVWIPPILTWSQTITRGDGDKG